MANRDEEPHFWSPEELSGFTLDPNHEHSPTFLSHESTMFANLSRVESAGLRDFTYGLFPIQGDLATGTNALRVGNTGLGDFTDGLFPIQSDLATGVNALTEVNARLGDSMDGLFERDRAFVANPLTAGS